MFKYGFGTAISAIAIIASTTFVSSAEIKHQQTVKNADGQSEFRLAYQGNVADGDLERLQAAIQQLKTKHPGDTEPYLDGDVRLFFDSEGGDYREAMRIAKYVAENTLTYSSYIDDNAKCYSACSILFFAGLKWEGEAGTSPNRMLAPNAKLGLSGPDLVLDDNHLNLPAVKAAYAESLDQIAAFLGLASTFNLKHSLFTELLARQAQNPLLIDTVDRLHRYRVGLDIKEPAKITPEMLSNHCANTSNWIRGDASKPSGSETSHGQAQYNELPSYADVKRGHFPKIVFQARPMNGKREAKRVRYVIPASAGAESSVAYCVIDVIDGPKQTFECLGIEDEMDEAAAAFKNVWQKATKKGYRPSYDCGGKSAITFVPPDTPNGEVEGILAKYEERSRLSGQREPNKDQENLPATIEQRALRETSKCGFRGNRIPKVAYTAVDINRDGRPDYLINFGKIHCETIPAYFGMTGGSRHDLWLSSGQGWKLEVSKELIEVSGVREREGQTLIEASAHPAQCKHEHIPCKLEFRWTGTKVEVGRVNR